jgi:serine/threonine protein kinase
MYAHWPEREPCLMAEVADDLLDSLAESFLTRYRRGERPSLSDYTRQHPDLASQIQELFPALVELEELGSALGPAPLKHSDAPSRLGEYRIIREIGRGGMGVVFEAVQESLGRRVALKLLPAGPATPPQMLDRFHREACIAARLHHGHIVPVFGVGVESGLSYYAMQYISGQGLDEVLKQIRARRAGSTIARAETRVVGDLSSASKVLCDDVAGYYRNIARLGEQVAEALEYAHSQGVLHRDIKPSNLLLDAGGHLWVTDFGLARSNDTNDLTQTGDVLGTPRFMAPERFRGAADVRSDVYSLGATLYELLTLEPAFAETDRAKLMEMVLRGRYLPPRHVEPAIPRDLETIVTKAMTTEPSGRYANSALLAEDLRRFVAGEPISARPPGALERVAKWSRRNPSWAAALTVAFVALATVAGIIGAYSFRLQNALSDANKNLGEAQSQNRRADENLAELRKAVDQFAGLILNEPQLHAVDLTETRRKLLTSAVTAYEKIIAQAGDGEELMTAQGDAHFQLGLILSQLGRNTESEQHNIAAITVWERLVERFPHKSRYRVQLAGALHNRGNDLEVLGRGAEAEGLIERASTICRDGLLQDPNNEFMRSSLASHCRGIGRIKTFSGAYMEASSAFRDGLELIEGLIRDRPKSTNYRAQEVAIRCALGFVFQHQGKLPEAEIEYRAAREAGRTALISFPECDEIKQELGQTVSLLAFTCDAQQNFTDAEVFALEAIDIFEKQHAKYPSQPLHAFELARVCSRLGQIHLHANQPGLGLNWANRSVDILRDNHLASAEGHLKVWAVRMILECRAYTLERLDRPAEAAADYLAAIPFCQPYEDWHRCLLARCTTLVRAKLLDDAEKSYHEAIQAYDEKIAENSADMRFPRDRVQFVFQLGEMLIRGRNVDEGRQLINDAVAERERLANVQDAPSIDLHSRMKVYNDAAIAWRHASRFAEALGWHDKAVAECDHLSRLPAEVEFAQQWRAKIMDGRAFGRMIVGDRVGAAEDYAAAAEAETDDVARRGFRIQQASQLLAAGDVTTACKIDENQISGGKIPDSDSFSAVRLMSLAAAALPANDLRRVPMLDRAIVYLKQAIESRKVDPSRLANHPDLVLLQDRDDFKALVTVK